MKHDPQLNVMQPIGASNRTPLHFCKSSEMARLLVMEYHAEVNAVDKGGKSPLHFVSEANDFATAQTLLELGAKNKLRDKNDATAVDLWRKKQLRDDRKSELETLLDTDFDQILLLLIPKFAPQACRQANPFRLLTVDVLKRLVQTMPRARVL